MDWYAVFVETGREHDVKKSLFKLVSDRELKCLVPSRRVAERRKGRFEDSLKPLFPGYVLIRTNMDTTLHQTLRNTPRIYKVLTDQDHSWARIPENEMTPILKLLQDGDVIDYSYVKVQNSEVCVLSGPMYGMEHLIRKVDKRKRRARVVLRLDGTERAVDLGVVLVPPEDPDAATEHLTGETEGRECEEFQNEVHALPHRGEEPLGQ